jgi:hypothetical protein
MITNSSANSLQKVIVEDRDISDFVSYTDGIKRWEVIGLQDWNMLSIQIDWSGLTGTLDAIVQIQMRNKAGMNWNNFTPLTKILDSAAGAHFFEDVDFTGQDVAVKLTMNNCTGGNFTAVMILKKK